jgi:hypothetical protein
VVVVGTTLSLVFEVDEPKLNMTLDSSSNNQRECYVSEGEREREREKEREII